MLRSKRSPIGTPSTPLSPSDAYEDDVSARSLYESPLHEVSFDWNQSLNVKGLQAVVPSDAYSFNDNALGNKKLDEYIFEQSEFEDMSVSKFASRQVRPSSVKTYEDRKVGVRIHQSAIDQQRPITAPDARSGGNECGVVSDEKHTLLKYKHRSSSVAASEHKSVRKAVVERILSRPENDAYRLYCTRSVKGLRLTSTYTQPRRIQDPMPEPAPYKPVMRSRTQRRKDEQEAEQKRKEEAELEKSPVRRAADGTPMYATVSAHKEQFDKNMELEKKREQEYDEHVRRIRQDRESLMRIRGADGHEYMYNERGFKVLAIEYEKVRNTPTVTPPKIEYSGPYFRGEILHKTAGHVENMRRMIKLRYENARWKSGSMPWTTYTPGRKASDTLYVPRTIAPGSPAHIEELKYGNTNANSASKFGTGNSEKKNIGSRDVKHPQDLDVLPLSYFRFWPEYGDLQNGDVCVTIEYCHSCHRHNFKTRHNAKKYLALANDCRQIIIRICSQFVCRLDVYLKPIEDHDPYKDLRHHHSMDYTPILNGNPGKSGGDKNSFTRVDVMEKIRFETSTNRCGAFEIQVAIRNSASKMTQHILFSKLFYGAWPSRQGLATNLDHMLSENLTRLPGELPMQVFEKNMADTSVCKNILDTRKLGDSSSFLAMRLEASQKTAHDELVKKHEIEVEALALEEVRIDMEATNANKKALSAQLALTTARNIYSDNVHKAKEKAREAALKQHRAWGATLDEEKWEAEYNTAVEKNGEPADILKLQGVVDITRSLADVAQASLVALKEARLALAENHLKENNVEKLENYGLITLEISSAESTSETEVKKSKEVAPSVTQISDSIVSEANDALEVTRKHDEIMIIGQDTTDEEETSTAEEVTGVEAAGAAQKVAAEVLATTREAVAAAAVAQKIAAQEVAAQKLEAVEVAARNKEVDRVRLEEMEKNMRADIKADLETKLQGELQTMLAASLERAKVEMENNLRHQLEAKLDQERIQRMALEDELNILRDETTRHKIEEKKQQQQVAVNMSSTNTQNLEYKKNIENFPVSAIAPVVKVRETSSDIDVLLDMVTSINTSEDTSKYVKVIEKVAVTPVHHNPLHDLLADNVSVTPAMIYSTEEKAVNAEEQKALDEQLEVSLDLNLDHATSSTSPYPAIDKAKTSFIDFHDDEFWEDSNSTADIPDTKNTTASTTTTTTNNNNNNNNNNNTSTNFVVTAKDNTRIKKSGGSSKEVKDDEEEYVYDDFEEHTIPSLSGDDAIENFLFD